MPPSPDSGSHQTPSSHHDRSPIRDGPAGIAERALAFAREQLGPKSEALLSDAAYQALVVSRMRNGAELEDAVLAEIHPAAALDREVANEFLAYFLIDLLRIARGRLSQRLRGFLDTWDLAQSVLGDVWQELGRVRFETRAQYISLLALRLSWKATDHHRAQTRMRRREDLRVHEDVEDLEVVAHTPSPASAAEDENERERLILTLMRLPERDRDLVRRHLAGESITDIMAGTGLSLEAARKALQRAIRRARRLIAPPNAS